MPAVPLVAVIRSGVEESVHRGDVVVVDANGEIEFSAGEPDRVVFARSSMKPLQAAVSLSLAPFEFPDREVAVMCASHNAEAVHVATVRSLLARTGVPEKALRCPAVRPWDDEARAADPQRRAINSDCSGKHGGMLAACVAQGWPLETYRDPGHPLQVRIQEVVEATVAPEAVPVGIDGCGVPVHAMPLRSMATIYARLVRPVRLGSLERMAARVVAAMRAEPYLVAGRNRADTAVMAAVPGIVVKGGAEGLVCAALVERGLGLAIKVRDGSSRAMGPALLACLRDLGALSGDQEQQLAASARPPVLGGGVPVGHLESRLRLTAW